MSYRTLIPAAALREHLDDPQWAVIDCRHSFQDPDLGRREYLEGHIPGAVFAHVDRDLSGAVIPKQTGRHPLPSVEAAALTFSGLGIDRGVQVAAYDHANGSVAARLWWMLRWLGHLDVAVLDGGWQRWQELGLPTREGEEKREPRRFLPKVRAEVLATAGEVERIRLDRAYRLYDVRAAERFRGEQEPIDPVAGHIPGALNFPYSENLQPDDTFLSPEALREKYRRVIGPGPVEQTVFYCGSGITAAHSVLAVVHSGLGEPRLYPGSWSEWIAPGVRPVATGED